MSHDENDERDTWDDPENYVVGLDEMQRGLATDRTTRQNVSVTEEDSKGNFHMGAWGRRLYHSGERNPRNPFILGYHKQGAFVKNVATSFKSLFKHIGVFGQTGKGKTTWATNGLAQLAFRDYGFTYISPANSDVTRLMQKLPDDRVDDVVYFKPRPPQLEQSVKLNLLDLQFNGDESAAERAQQKEQAVEEAIEILSDSDTWGVRMDRVSKTVLRAILDLNDDYIETGFEGVNFTLLDIHYILRNYREELADVIETLGYEKADNTLGRLEYLNTIEEMEEDDELEPLLGRFEDFTQNPLYKDIVGGDESTVDFYADIIKEGKILLVDIDGLSKEAKKLVSTMVTRQLWNAVQTRARYVSTERQREPYFLCIDEADDILNNGMNAEDIATKARKYRLSFWLMTQNPSQFPAAADEFLKNANTFVSFGVDEDDARKVARRLQTASGEVSSDNVANIDQYRFWASVTDREGVKQGPIAVESLADYPPRRDIEEVEEIKRRSVDQYGDPVITDYNPKAPVGVDDIVYKQDEASDLGSQKAQQKDVVDAINIAEHYEHGPRRGDGEGRMVSLDSVEFVLDKLTDAETSDYALSELLEQNKDVFNQQTRKEETMVRLTPDGYREAQEQDTGSAGSAGKEQHRELLRRTQEELARLGYAARLVEQDGDELADAIAYPFAPVDDLVLPTDEPINVETESKSIDRPAQVLNNLRKAREQDRHTLYIVNESEPFDDNGRRILNILTKPPHAKEPRVSEKHAERAFYNENSRLGAESDTQPLRKRPHDKETRWVELDNDNIELRDGKGMTFAEFDDMNAFLNWSTEDFSHYVEEDDEQYHVYDQTTRITTVDSKSDVKDRYMTIKRPFVPSEAYPENDIPATGTWTIGIMPDYANETYDRLMRYNSEKDIDPFLQHTEDEQPPWREDEDEGDEFGVF